jgi:RNA polymerase sigma factor (sigma-70 family)
MLKSTSEGERSLMPARPPGDITDTELIERICEGDQQAFERLYKAYFHRLFRFSYRMTRRLDRVEEIINDVMYVVWRKADTFTPGGRVSTWIFGIAYNKCLKTLTERTTGDHLTLDDAEDLLPQVQDSGLKNLEIEDWLSVAFGKLPAEQRAVLELTYHHDLPYGEIAVIVGCPENTVKTRMFHARKKIRALFPELLGETTDFYEGKSL